MCICVIYPRSLRFTASLYCVVCQRARPDDTLSSSGSVGLAGHRNRAQDHPERPAIVMIQPPVPVPTITVIEKPNAVSAR